MIHITTATTLKPSKDSKAAVGRNTKWNGKMSGLPPKLVREEFQNNRSPKLVLASALSDILYRKKIRNIINASFVQ